MLTVVDDRDGDRVMTVQISENTMDAELVDQLASVLDDVEHGEIENVVLQFIGGVDSAAGDFPTWHSDPVRSDMRYFAKWDETLRRISRLKAKTLVAYDGRVGAAAIQAGFVTDLRVASEQARLVLTSSSGANFPGMAAYWLPKFVGAGQARRMLMLGAALTAEQACHLGLVDVVDDTVQAAVDATVKATAPITPEAACFTRRILDDCYLLEHSAAVDLAKAARFQLGMSIHNQALQRPYAREGNG
jgi:enoyl-CoA hydratase/carnithine racemase